MGKLLTIGTFDVPHIGHANLIRQCEQFSSDIWIGVNSDLFVEKYKGERPLYGQAERMAFMEIFGHPVLLNYSAGSELISVIRPNIIAIGTDWVDRDYLGQIGIDRSYLELNKIALLYLPYTRGVSTTEIKGRIK